MPEPHSYRGYEEPFVDLKPPDYGPPPHRRHPFQQAPKWSSGFCICGHWRPCECHLPCVCASVPCDIAYHEETGDPMARPPHQEIPDTGAASSKHHRQETSDG